MGKPESWFSSHPEVPDLELRGGPGLDLLAMAAIFHSVISSFLPKIRGGLSPPGSSPRSATASKQELMNPLWSGRVPGSLILILRSPHGEKP